MSCKQFINAADDKTYNNQILWHYVKFVEVVLYMKFASKEKNENNLTIA